MAKSAVLVLLLALSCISASYCALPTRYGLLATGDLTTEDQDGPYKIPQQQAAEVQGAIAAKTASPSGAITDKDVLDFLTNTECLESRFDTFAAFGHDIPLDLLSPTGKGYGRAIGGRKAKLSNEMQSWIEEVALDEEGHVRFIREVLGKRSNPCPEINIDTAFADFFDSALGMSPTPRFDPYANDVNFLLSMWTLEEIGATGDTGSILLCSNPGIAAGVAGLATSASYQSAVDRMMIWERRNETVHPYGVSVSDFVLAVSNHRDSLDGPLEIDQGIYNFDTNFIAVPTLKINLVLRILTNGASTGRGCFFPTGIFGQIKTPAGYADQVDGYQGYPGYRTRVRTLSNAGRNCSLNRSPILPKPAPKKVQLEASGAEFGQGYNITDVPGQGPPLGPYDATFVPRS
eukprot:jgi/Chlat1/6215/Chrsp44S05750